MPFSPFLPLHFQNQFWVAPTGSDSNAGTQASPWLTITKAGNMARAGDVIHVMPGTYTENVITRGSGTPNAHITFISEVVWGAQIVGGTGDAWTINGDWVDLYGFDVTATGGTVGIFVKASHIKIDSCKVHDVGITGPCQHGGGAIDVATTSGYYETYDCTVTRCLVFNTGQATCFPTYRIHGIYFAEPFGYGYNNIVYGIQGDGFSCWHGFSDGIVANNTIFNCAGNGIIIGAGDVPPPGTLKVCDNCVVANNIARDCGLIGIRHYGYDTSTVGLNNKIWNNCSFGSVSGTDFNVTGNVYSPVASVTTDPLFVNYLADGSGDYQLQTTSPCRNSGTATGAPSEDYLRSPRPLGAGYDMGCYERS